MGWNLSSLIPDLTRRVEHITELPPVPEMAQRLLALKNDPGADARKLGALIELDPAVAAQIMRYAGSAFFNYQGKIESIPDAVSRVLGFDRSLHIALGLAAGNALRHSKEGPLGIKAYWRHSLYSASLMEALTAVMPKGIRPAAGMVYLAGLLHDIGFLLLGHLLEPEFDILNEAVAARPEVPVNELEMELLGVTHNDLGVWLLRKWKLPAEVLTTVSNHHNVHYQGDHAVFANLACVADRLLARCDVGDGCDTHIPPELLQSLGLSMDTAYLAFQQVMGESAGLDTLVSRAVSNG